ncbi:MAG: DUF4335 domain-containing protein [Prochloraceae cyanobacterium]|nr:DUF4335 domain-containing protein [Prochloraceae cyanobacterium]
MLVQRYTPPTCTLEIGAKSSFGRPMLLDELSFKLRFDDPRKGKQEQITISGDRERLDLLCNVVDRYLEEFLKRSRPEKKSLLKSRSNNEPFLQTKNAIAHELFLGFLADDPSKQAIELSALQLFDLATALDQYNIDIEAFQSRSDRPWFKRAASIWGTALVSMLVGAGLTTLGVRMFNLSNTQTEPIASTEEGVSSVSQQSQIFDVLPPSPTISLPQSKPDAIVPPSISSGEDDLPPPPLVEPLKPSNIRNKRSNTSISAKPRNLSAPSLASLPDISISNNNGPNSASFSQISRNVPTRPTVETNSQSKTNSRAEVKNYLQQRWKPPEDLSRTIEYRLTIDSNGKVERIVPLGYASKVYLERTGIPQKGEPFVSFEPGQEKQTIRVVMSPDGTVKTFLE